METLLAYKTKLRTNKEQAKFFSGCSGYSRFVFNWALNDRIDRRKQELKTSYYEQRKRFNAIKYDEFEWCAEYPQVIMDYAFQDLDTAYKNFFRRVKKGEAPGFPKFKNRYGKSSFRLKGSIKVESNRIKLPKIGWVILAERGYFPTDTRVRQATISRDVDNWYVSILVEEDKQPIEDKEGVIGVDMGVKHLAVLSNGDVIDSPDVKALNEKVAKLQKKLARQTKGSSNREKTKVKIAKVHRKIRNIRNNTLHNASAHIVRNCKPERIVIEDLNVSGMTRRAKPKQDEDGNYLRNNAAAKSGLNKAILNSGLGEFRRQIEYKAKWAGSEITIADRFYPSSKTCSNCGEIDSNLKLSDRTYNCKSCGFQIDRDLNAAINLENYND
ncbi:transposase [Pseudomonadales bacterium]|nr:transposase [Pseudomonadales bacterium]